MEPSLGDAVPAGSDRAADSGLIDAPGPAVAFQVGLAIAVLWLTGLREMLSYIGFTLGLSAAATVGGLFALRWREGRERVPIPGHPWVPGAFVVFTLGAVGFMAVREPREAALGLATVALGVPVYLWLRRDRGR